MPHAIIKTSKNLDDIECIDIFRYKNRGIFPLDKPFRCFLDIYKKQDLLVIKLNKATRSIISDELKNAILDIAKKIANNLEAQITFHNLEQSNTFLHTCDCFQKVEPQMQLIKPQNINNNLEIGFGKGEFLLDLAQQNPDEFFFGIEVYGKDYLIALDRCCAHKIKNVKLINYDARYALDLFENNFFNHIYVNFPEPWFKIWRIRHSIFNKITFKKIVEKLAQDGFLHIITDNYPFAVHSAIIADNFNLKPSESRFITIENNFSSLYAKKWKRYNRVFYSLGLKKTFMSSSNDCCKREFPLKLSKLNYKSAELIFKIIGIYENKKFDYKIIEVVIGNYLAQRIFFGFLHDTIFLLPQTNFVYTKDFCEALEKVVR